MFGWTSFAEWRDDSLIREDLEIIPQGDIFPGSTNASVRVLTGQSASWVTLLVTDNTLQSLSEHTRAAPDALESAISDLAFKFSASDEFETMQPGFGDVLELAGLKMISDVPFVPGRDLTGVTPEPNLPTAACVSFPLICENAKVLETGPNGTVSFDFNLTTNSDEACVGTPALDCGVWNSAQWFSWTASDARLVCEINIDEYFFADSVVAVFSDNCTDAITCDDDSGANLLSSAAFIAEANQTYRIGVGSFGTTQRGGSGTASIRRARVIARNVLVSVNQYQPICNENPVVFYPLENDFILRQDGVEEPLPSFEFFPVLSSEIVLTIGEAPLLTLDPSTSDPVSTMAPDDDPPFLRRSAGGAKARRRLSLPMGKRQEGNLSIAEGRNVSVYLFYYPTDPQSYPQIRYEEASYTVCNSVGDCDTAVIRFELRDFYCFNDNVFSPFAPLPPSAAPPSSSPRPDGTPGRQLVSVPRIRKDFPPTWFFEANRKSILNETSGLYESLIHLPTTPDTITTWDFWGVALSNNGKLQFPTESVSRISEQPVFLLLRWPDECIYDEIIAVSISLFNYALSEGNFTIAVDVAAGDFAVLEAPLSLVVAAQSSMTFMIRLQTLKVGEKVPLIVQVTSDVGSDAVQRVIRVKSRGLVRQVDSYLAIGSGQVVEIEASSITDCVNGSFTSFVEISADSMRPSLNLFSIESAASTPLSAVEPLLDTCVGADTLQYFGATSGLPQLESVIRRRMGSALANEASFRAAGGAYSLLRNGVPSLFLSTQFAQCLARAVNYVTINRQSQQRTFSWLYSVQNAGDGSFTETGLSLTLPGQDSRVTATSMAVLALLTAPDGRQAEPLDAAIRFLETHVAPSNFSRAISLYALVQAGSRVATKIEELQALLEPLLLETSSLTDVETLSYALLAHVALQNSAQADAFAAKLFALRNRLGLFGPTGVSTIIASEALFRYSVRLYTPKLEITAIAVNPPALFTFNEANRFVDRRLELQGDGNFSITSFGDAGTLFAQVTTSCTTLDIRRRNLDLDVGVTWLGSQVESSNVQVCVARPEGSTKGPEVVRISTELLTGYEANEASLQSLIETGLVSEFNILSERFVEFIFLLAEAPQQCLTFTVSRTSDSTNLLEVATVVRSFSPGAVEAVTFLPSDCEPGTTLLQSTVSNVGVLSVLNSNAGTAYRCGEVNANSGEAPATGGESIPWWVWLLVALGVIVLGIAAAFIIQYCWKKEKVRKRARFDKKMGLGLDASQSSQISVSGSDQFTKSTVKL